MPEEYTLASAIQKAERRRPMKITTGETEAFLTSQIITYIGNKRALLGFIEAALEEVRKELHTDKLEIVDLFAGSGIVSRYFKQHARRLIVNDLEKYSYVINGCYLANKSEIDLAELEWWYTYLQRELEKGLKSGFISELYAPRDANHISEGERVFFTPRNARYIDTARQLINEIPATIRHFFIAPLLTEASVKNNTSGVFKGFYKDRETGIGLYGGKNQDALSRITRDIHLPFPIFSNYDCVIELHCTDANTLVDKLPMVDLAYIDPPYNQHPYGSNYFMLNLINDYERPENISKVSGIPTDWNRSTYNKSKQACNALLDLCQRVKSRFLLISFNSEGFIKHEQMMELLSQVGSARVMEKKYNTFRGSRNLKDRELHVKEYLYLVEKEM